MKKNILWFAVVLLTAFVGVSCSNEDILSEVPTPNPSKEVAENIVTFTATLDSKGGSGMRAISTSGVTTWEENEEILITYKNTSNVSQEAKATVTSVSGGKATITAPLVDPKDGCVVHFYYPYESQKETPTKYLATDQDGSLTTLSQYFDQADDDSWYGGDPYYLSVSGGVATLPSSINMVNKNVIWKLSFKDGANDITSSITKLEIHASDGGTTDYTITPSPSRPITDYFYVAMGDLSNDNIVITAYTSTGMYRRAKSNITLEMGKIYTTTGLAMNKVEIGKLFGADGNVYADAAEVSAASTTAIGVVAYIGTNNYTENGKTISGSDFVGHGLVLCLKNAASEVCWSNVAYTSEFAGQEVDDTDDLKRSTNVSGYTNTATLAAKTDAETKYPAAYQAKNYTGLTAPATGTTGWFLPSAQQWVKMIEGLGELADGAPNFDGTWFDNSHSAVNKWEAALSKAGSGKYDSMTGNLLYYWSSSECNDNNAVCLYIDATGTGGDYGFKWSYDPKITAYYLYQVRPVLAF